MHYPPAKFVFNNERENRVGRAVDSLISEGCILSGGQVHRSILSPKVRVNSYSHVEGSILFENVTIGLFGILCVVVFGEVVFGIVGFGQIEQVLVNLAAQFQRKVAFVGRGMVETSQIAQRLGYLKMPADLAVRESEVKHLPPELKPLAPRT